MDNKTFKKLEYTEKRKYLLAIFYSTKDIYPIYRKIHNLLSNKEDLRENILDKIHENIEEIGQENERIKMKNIQLKKEEIKKEEEIKKNREIKEIENNFI